MIVDIVHLDGVSVLEAESHPPISGHRNGIVPFQDSLQGVKPKAWHIRILSRVASVQYRKNVAQLVDMLRSHVPGRSPIVQSFEASMFERADHSPAL